MPDYRQEAKDYERSYFDGWEGEAHAQRHEFLRRFPANDLPSLTLKKYAIGQNGRETFCYWVEPGTRKWATIVGATSDKFGVYHGRKKPDQRERFRYTKKFGRDLPAEGEERAAFREIRKALLALLRDGGELNFVGVDTNPLSQMLKAKVLSLYYPDKYIPICSKENLRDLAPKLDLDATSLSQIQHEALVTKRKSPGVRSWSTLKYTAFLYDHVLQHGPIDRNLEHRRSASKGASKDGRVDFEKLMALWRKLGKQSEAYALAQERARLTSLGYANLARRIKDRTDQPRHGYDYESFSGPNQPRYIEVKTFTAINGKVSRFFLSQNEHAIASIPKMGKNYYFYLVVYGPNQEPIDCQMRSAMEVLAEADIEAQNYLVRLNRERTAH